MSARPSVIIVGAGIGGLAAAIDLATRGCRVTVFDKEPAVGGKARQLRVGDVGVDAGPSVLTMRDVFDDLFARAGTHLDQHIRLEPLDLLARHRWRDGSALDLYPDPEQSAAAIGAFAGPGEEDGFRRFSAYARSIHETVAEPFIRGPRPTPWSIVRDHGWRALAMALRIDGFRSMWRALGDFFDDPRLRQLFGRYATYAGNSPFLAPATFNLIADVEAAGVWRPVGGMHAVAAAMADVARDCGVRIVTSTAVDAICAPNGRVVGVDVRRRHDETSHHVPADSVVFAGDVAALSAGYLGDDVIGAVPVRPPQRRSLSALTWCAQAEVSGWPLAHHNVIFGDAYKDEFDAIFTRGELPKQPTVYICAQDVGAHNVGTQAGQRDAQRLLILVNAPARGDGRNNPPNSPLNMPLSTDEVLRCEEHTFAHLAHCGLTIDAPPESIIRTDPRDWERLSPASGGSLYGEASHHWSASMRRLGARSKVPGLYLCGGTVHPGAGVPMAALSGRQVAHAVAADRLSTVRSLPAVTRGGTPTSSATTAPAT